MNCFMRSEFSGTLTGTVAGGGTLAPKASGAGVEPSAMPAAATVASARKPAEAGGGPPEGATLSIAGLLASASSTITARPVCTQN